jgi:pimeloyl-ACP methyl ester carboxylesterase
MPAAILELHDERMGRADAPVVLFIHGITESSRYFTTRIGPLADRFHLVLPDLPGFGRSPKPVSRYDPDHFVDALGGFLESADLASRPLAIVGHSLGAIIGLEFAARFPERVRRLVLLSLPRYPDPDTAHAIFRSGSPSYRKLLQQHSLGENLLQLRRIGFETALRSAAGIPWQVIADSRLFTFQSLTSTLENCLLHYSVEKALAAAPVVPTILLHGQADQVAPFESVAGIQAEHPHIALHAFRGAGHHILHTHTREALRLIRAHLETE